MISESSDPKVLRDLWKIKEDAYEELTDLKTVKEKISKRIKDSKESAQKISKHSINQ